MKRVSTHIFFTALLIARVWSTQTVSPIAAGETSASQDPPPALSKRHYKDFIQEAKPSVWTYQCEELIQPFPQFRCTNFPRTSLSFNKRSKYFQTVIYAQAGSLLKTFWTKIELIDDPKLRDRKYQGYLTQQKLGPDIAGIIEGIEAGEDFLMTLQEAYGSQALILLQLQTQASSSFDSRETSIILKSFQAVRRLHQKGLVAINYEITSNPRHQEEKAFRLSELSCITRVGEPVGTCNFSPLLTDPAVLKSDGTMKADVAMDLYVLGLHVYFMLHDEPGVMAASSVLDEVAQTGLFHFRKGQIASIAFLTCYLVQANRTARSDPANLQNALNFAAEDKKLTPLTEDFVYDPKEDPLLLPAFEKLKYKALMIDRPGKAHARHSLLWWSLGIGGGILFLLIVAWLILRSKSTQPPQDPNTQKPLQDVTQEEPQPVTVIN